MFNQDWHPENLKQLALELGYQTNAYYDEFESLKHSANIDRVLSRRVDEYKHGRLIALAIDADEQGTAA